jgi:hypothetical protein
MATTHSNCIILIYADSGAMQYDSPISPPATVCEYILEHGTVTVLTIPEANFSGLNMEDRL